MAYDNKTYGNSPFVQSAATKTKAVPSSTRRSDRQTTPAPEALSDQMSESQTAGSADADPPALPTDYVPVAKPSRTVSLFYVPKGRVTGLNLICEALGWLMAWGTVGFFRAYVPTPVLTVFDRLFNPYGMAGITLLSALFIGQLLRRYQLKIASLRTFATTAIEYGETHHRADTQTQVDELLSAAATQTENASRWLVSWLTALGCLFVVGAFY
jgi:hypothetical protein